MIRVWYQKPTGERILMKETAHYPEALQLAEAREDHPRYAQAFRDGWRILVDTEDHTG